EWGHRPPPPRRAVVATAPASQSPCGPMIHMAGYDTPYEFSADELSKSEFYRQGLTWGGLVVPYKYYLSARSFKSNASAVAFLGYEGWFPGVSLSAVVALGPGIAPSTSSSPASSGSGPSSSASTSPGSTTVVTYTVATGLIGSFGDARNFKVGLLFGRDYEGKDAQFPYENKTWMALSIGAGF
ncbi:MAG: hypothetical protein ACREUG_03760, partial [Steroidobacteraceae bacterium]